MTNSVCISLTLFTFLFCHYSFAFQINTSGTFKFSDRLTTQLMDSTILVYNNASLTNLPKNFTANSTIEFEYILSNENILFATWSTVYILNPFRMEIISQQPYLRDRIYVTQGWENKTVYFGEESTNLYFMNPSNGLLQLIDAHYNTTEKRVFSLSGHRILVVNLAESSFLVKDFAANILFSHVEYLHPFSKFSEPKYQVFPVVYNSTVKIWSLETYTVIAEQDFPHRVESVWMPSPSYVIVHTSGEDKLHLYSRNFKLIGQISLCNLCRGQYFSLNKDTLVVPSSNHTVVLYSIENFQMINLGTLVVPETFDCQKIDVISMQNNFLALISGKKIFIFDYARGLLMRTMLMNRQRVPQRGETKFIDGSFFARFLGTESSGNAGYIYLTLEGGERSSIRSKLNYSKSTSSKRRISQAYPSISTQGENQNNTIIYYIEAPSVGEYATQQVLDVYMNSNSKVPIYFMIKVTAFNADGNDTCDYIMNAGAQSSSNQTQTGPIGYGQLATSAYSSSSPNYVINYYHLEGNTQYYVKVCPDATENNYQGLLFTTKDNNYKVAKFLFVLSEAIDSSLANSFLCYIQSYLNFPNSNLYSTTGQQCDQSQSALMKSPEVYEGPSRGNRRLQDNSGADTIGILLYGNAFTESNDTSVDTAVQTLNSGSSLQFTDSNGNNVYVTNITYVGDLNLSAPILPDNIVVSKSSSSITLSNVIISSMPGYIYGMIVIANSSNAPPIYLIKNTAVFANGIISTDSVNGSSFYWYYDGGTDPVTMEFDGLSSNQQYSIYYFATNEDVSQYQSCTSLYAKTIQTDSSINSTLTIIIIVLSIALAILIAVIVACCFVRYKRRQHNSYKSNDVIQVRRPVKIRQEQHTNAGLKIQDMRVEKETLSKALAELERANQEMISSSSFNGDEHRSLVTPEELERLKKKVKDLEAKITNLEQEKLCTICYERPKDLLLGCGHLMCSECGKSMEECPFDKTKIKSKKKFYEVDN